MLSTGAADCGEITQRRKGPETPQREQRSQWRERTRTQFTQALFTATSACESRSHFGPSSLRRQKESRDKTVKVCVAATKLGLIQAVSANTTVLRHLAAGTLPAPPRPPSLLHRRFLRRLVSGDRLNWFDGWSKRFSIF